MKTVYPFLAWFCICFLVPIPFSRGQETKVPAKKATEVVDPDHVAKVAKSLDLFKKHVKGILQEHCLNCHGGKRVESEFDLADRDTLLKGGQHGKVVVPGKSGESVLMKMVRHEKGPNMPHDRPKLSEASLRHLAQWIDTGAHYEEALVASRAKKVAWTERIVPSEAKNYWAFQPLKAHTPPTVKNLGWVRNPLDAFILARQEAQGLKANAPPEKHVLLRRAYFDLIGLPPSPEEVDAFLKDTSANAYERAIDRLLANPHYGERWGRHWLDLARFAESHGFEHDYDRPTAYHYRDAVIEALNRDLPYHTFVKWQIAGDEYEPTNNLALKLTGFLAAGVHSTQITKNEVEKHRYDELDDKLNTLGLSMLGLSVGCARCHDHKYDPIPMRDYYRMLATFTTTIRSEIDLTVDADAYQKAKAKFDLAHVPVRAALEKYESEELPGQLARWEKSANLSQLPWEIVEFKEMKSKEGAKFVLQADGSALATEKNGKFDEYTFVVHTQAKGIHAIRLEALAHPSMVKSGPGRAGNGNFALSNFKVEVSPLPSKAKPTAIQLKNARATFEQKGLPVAATIDGDPKSAWAIDPQFGKDHAAVFDTESPFGFEGGTAITFTLKFNNNDGHQMGRVRLSLGTGTLPTDPFRAGGIPAVAREALRTAPERRSAEQKHALLAWYRNQDAGWIQRNTEVLKHLAQQPKQTTVKALIASEGLAAVRLHTQGEDFFPETYYLRRGDPDNKEGVATQSFLQALMPTAEGQMRWKQDPPKGWRTSYRRRGLAEWITDTEQGAGSLLARVMVNRLWQHHMGRGIVATPSDFGSRGDAPTHPELLDWLASEFVLSGWSLKAMHRLIMTSAAYQQGSQPNDANSKIDRDNKYFWRNPSRRVEAEIVRDNLLAVSGQLDTKLFGPGTLDPNSKRRSIYFTVKRSKLMPMMVIFDAPEALGTMAERPTTTIAPQALHLLNNPQSRELAKALARRIAPDSQTSLDDAIRKAYQIAFARLPNREEIDDGKAFITQQMATYADGNTRRESALADFCQVVMCLNEFVYVD